MLLFRILKILLPKEKSLLSMPVIVLRKQLVVLQAAEIEGCVFRYENDWGQAG